MERGTPARNAERALRYDRDPGGLNPALVPAVDDLVGIDTAESHLTAGNTQNTVRTSSLPDSTELGSGSGADTGNPHGGTSFRFE